MNTTDESTTTGGTPNDAPPTPATTPPARRLTRRTDDRLLGGVASGLADFFALDPVLVRIGFVILGVFGGGGVVLYLALWLLVPERQTGEVLVSRSAAWVDDPLRQRLGAERGPAFWIGVALICLAAIAILDSAFDGGVVAALVLIGIGVALFRSDGVQAPPAPAVPGTTPPSAGTDVSTGTPSDAVPSDAVPTDAVPGDAGPPAIPPPAAPGGQAWAVPPPPARPRRERSILGRLTLGLAVLWAGIAAFLDQASNSIDFTVAGIVGVAMAIIGAGLLVGAWAGRARWLMLVGVLLTPVLVGATFADRIDVPFSAGLGERDRYVLVGETFVEEELFAGELTFDLVSDWMAIEDEPDVERRIVARVGAGELRVRVPAHWTIDLDASVGAGSIDVRGAERIDVDGVDRTVDRLLPGEPGAPTIHLDLRASVGEVRIDRMEVTR